ncbi:Uncharacterised protein [Actinobacillus pleuropneumoniae]|jgi:hypothetical protein|uniref:Uncharacterized protein n=1 Tax=Paenibacillus lautus TaxID=1401 RepID=A0A385TT43_PAELA|nr:hypothetical protein D5F53_20480 [Paenibacillus lautus]VTR49521.1 Uncharacterised protein [Actinobacillus pleuropneumoniae]
MFPQETYFESICLGPGEFKIRCRLLLDSLRVRYRIYELSVELMKFYIARKPTYASRSLIFEVASIEVFLSKADFLNNLEI